MPEQRLTKQVFHGELASGHRPRYKPRQRYKDCLKKSLQNASICIHSWQAQALDRSVWRKAVQDGVANFELSRMDQLALKQSVRKGISNISGGIQNVLACHVCGRLCLSQAGLVSHVKSHDRRPPANFGVVLNRELIHVCLMCGKRCRSSGDLKRHAKVHGAEATSTSSKKCQENFPCSVCGKLCKSLAGLESHIRAFHSDGSSQLRAMVILEDE